MSIQLTADEKKTRQKQTTQGIENESTVLKNERQYRCVAAIVITNLVLMY